MIKILNVLVILTFISAFALLGLISFWLLYPYEPLVIKNLPMQVSPKVVKPGDTLKLTVNYCKYMDLPTTTSRRFIDNLIYAAPTFITNNPMGCHIVVANVIIPAGLASETYHIEQMFTYQVNPIRQIEIVANSEPFQIVNERL